MLQFLINLLTPIFEGMGVSPTDVATYVNNLSGYIYAILGTLALAIVAMAAARFVVKKGQAPSGALGRGAGLGAHCHHPGQRDLLRPHVQQSGPHPEL